MEPYITFYNSFLAIEVAVLSVLIAIIFVYLQLLYSNFSYRHIVRAFIDWKIIAFGLVGLLDLFLTVVALYYVTVSGQDIFPGISLNIQPWPVRGYYVLTVLLLFALSVSFFVWYLVSNFTKLRPEKALVSLCQKIRYEELRDYLWAKYGIDKPLYISTRTLRGLFDEDGKTQEQRRKEEKEEMEKEQKVAEMIKKIDKYEKSLGIKNDPLVPIRDALFQFILKSDIDSIRQSIDILGNIGKSFIERSEKIMEKVGIRDEGLVEKYVGHMIYILSDLMELADREGLTFIIVELFDVGDVLAKALIRNGHSKYLDKIFVFWEDYFEAHPRLSIGIFSQLIDRIESVVEMLMRYHKKGDVSNEDVENLMRSLSGIGSRVVSGYEEPLRVVITNNPVDTKTDAYFRFLLRVGRFYIDDPSSYPIVYFGSLWVVGREFIRILKEGVSEETKHDMNNNVYEVARLLRDFAVKALDVKNTNGVALSVQNLEELFDMLKKSELEESLVNVMAVYLDVAFRVYIDGENLKKDEIFGDIGEHMISYIKEAEINVDKQVKEIRIHSHNFDHDKSWEFVTLLGKALDSNFGFMFDPSTGELYPSDDPRRGA